MNPLGIIGGALLPDELVIGKMVSDVFEELAVAVSVAEGDVGGLTCQMLAGR